MLPHCQLKSFYGGGHEVTMELPDDCAAAVGAFLTDASPKNWCVCMEAVQQLAGCSVVGFTVRRSGIKYNVRTGAQI